MIAAPFPVVVADFNEDGSLDLATGNTGNSTIGQLWGTPSGAFLAQASLADPGNGVGPLAVADLNADRHQDLIVGAKYNQTGLYVLWGDGAGGFPGSTLLPLSDQVQTEIHVGDINEDGTLDLLVLFGAGQIWAGLNQSDGGFRLTEPIPSPGFSSPYARSFAVSDFDRDGHLDLVVVDYNTNLFATYFGYGDGGFAPGSMFTSPLGTFQVRAGDFNADGYDDLVAVNMGNVTLFLNQTDGGFASTPAVVCGECQAVALGDFNGDGSLDWVAGGYGGLMAEGFGYGDGGLSVALEYNAGSDSQVATGDFNLDGRLDVVNCSAGSNYVQIFFGQP